MEIIGAIAAVVGACAGIMGIATVWGWALRRAHSEIEGYVELPSGMRVQGAPDPEIYEDALIVFLEKWRRHVSKIEADHLASRVKAGMLWVRVIDLGDGRAGILRTQRHVALDTPRAFPHELAHWAFMALYGDPDASHGLYFSETVRRIIHDTRATMSAK